MPTAPGLMLDVATMEEIMSPREFHGGFAVGILNIDGWGDGLHDLVWFYAGFLLVFLLCLIVCLLCLRVGFHGPPLPSQPCPC